MGKNKEEQARLEGMAQALRIAKEKGIEGLEEEIRMRNNKSSLRSAAEGNGRMYPEYQEQCRGYVYGSGSVYSAS